MNPFEPPKSAASKRRVRRDDQEIDPMALIAMIIICGAIALGQLFR